MSQPDGKLIGKRIADRYCITGEIGKGGMGAVYKAIPFDDPSHSVAIKVIHRGGKLGYEDLMRFQKEAALMSRLHHPNIVVFHELGIFAEQESGDEGVGSGYYIVMEIADGTNLKESLERDSRKDLAFFFQVGLQVSKALDYTHGKNIVHRDIKPHNIIVGKAWRDQRGVTVKVLDFGVAGLAEAINYTGGEKGSSPRAFQEAAGTPLYMAPEQTALLEAPIDHRVDLYSLGCVLYELLAGRPPFQASSREKLEKEHVFTEPESLTNLRPDVPPLVEKMVHKLLAKHPDDRYQTAFALHADLNRAKTMFEKAGRPQGISFPLGLKDQFQAVSAQLKMVGRDSEFATLVEGYDAVSAPRGRSRLALIKGSAGIGKSRLKADFQAYLANRKVKFVSGSFSQHENALPFNALANGFNEYLYRVIRSHPHEAEELRRRFRNTLGPTAHMIAAIVPGLKPFLSDIEEPPRDDEEEEFLDSPESFKKFAKAFSDFTRCLGTDNQPVVFLYDDLHWADEKSLDLIDQFFTNANTLQFYLIVTQRTDLHVENKRFNEFVEKFRKLRRRFMEVELSPLSEIDVKHIVGNVLSSPESVGDDLVGYLYNESRGNPMHLVELTRVLVSANHIFPKSAMGGWEYDIESLTTTKIRLNTIDLILSRIQDYQEFDRHVLGIAATIGLTFQFEVLLLDGRTQSVSVMKAIQRAMDEGLVIRVSDDSDLKHLGKTFMFAHKKARDAIYESLEASERKNLHRTIGEKLEMAIPTPSEKTLFALAHHFNAAMLGETTEDRDLASRALKYNTEAGMAAKKGRSWQTAERYYENALRIMESWRDDLAGLEERARIQETLADLIAAQNALKKAQYAFRKLLGLELPIKRYSRIAYKTMQLQMMRGIVSDTHKLVVRTLQHIRRPVPDTGFSSAFYMWFGLLVDMWPSRKKNKRLFKVLNLAYALRKQDQEKLADKYSLIAIYRMGARVNMRRNKELALMYMHFAVDQAVRGRGDSEQLIRTVIDRAAYLSYLGSYQMSYKLFEQSMEAARTRGLRLTNVYGYGALMRVLTLDHIKERNEDLSANLRIATKYISRTDDRLAYARMFCYTLYRDLVRCSFRDVSHKAHYIPKTIPTRNWMTPQAYAFYFFSCLLQGKRDEIVRRGEKFIRRRQVVQGREDDQFMRIVHSIVNYASGDHRKARDNFVAAMKDFIIDKNNEFFFPYEEDFIALYALILPVLFEQENGKPLMSVNDMKYLLVRIDKRVGKIKGQDRAVPLLCRARLAELLGKENKVRPLYDQALRAAKISGNHLVQTFGYLWFGLFLLDEGQVEKKDYVRRALMPAMKLRMKSVIQFIRKESERRGLRIKEIDQLVSTTTAKSAVQHGSTIPSRLYVEHLNHICTSAESDSSLEEDIAESLEILRKFYHAKNVYCIITTGEDGAAKLIHPSSLKVDRTGLLNYVEPYVHVRSTLYLPSNDAPWAQQSSGLNLMGEETTRNQPMHTDTKLLATSNNLDATNVIQTVPGSMSGDTEATQLESTQVELTGQSLGGTQGTKGNLPQSLAMNALIPLRADFGTVGVLFVEEIEPRHSKGKSFSRSELDQFGAQFAMMLQRKTREDLFIQAADSVVEMANAVYQPGTFTLEKVDWIKQWSKGRLRTQRETSWYLGLCFGDNTYVLALCMLTGDALVRERLASMLWHQFHVLRSLAVASGRRHVEASDLRDEITGLLGAVPKASYLDGIALAFTVFNKEDGVATSGHFGTARPWVVGAENVVTPFNEVVMHFSNNRDLRYWEVAASVTEPHAYILSYDTSKLDRAGIRHPDFDQLVDTDGVEGSHAHLASMVGEENLPRYYVAAIAGAQELASTRAESPLIEEDDVEEDQAS